MNRRARASLIYYLFLLTLFYAVDLLFFSQSPVQEISYKEFRDDIDAGRVQQVVITSDRIYGLLKKPATSDSTAERTGSSESRPQRQATADTNRPSAGSGVETARRQRATAAVSAADTSRPQSVITIHKKQTPWRLRLKQVEEEHQKNIERQFTVIPLHDPQLIEELQAQGVDYRGKVESHWLSHVILNWIVPFFIFFLLWGVLMRRMAGSSSFLQLGKSKARIYAVDPSQRVTFKDVGGIDEAVEEVKEIVDFLREPAKYTHLGARLPKGLLLVGPPGTGKTLLARAVAGESGVPFFSLSGSDFVEMFVGLGASRVRDLFVQAKAKAPCIVFIDELDAIGKSRGQVPAIGGHDERENTLNQLLTEMDGFDSRVGIIIMAATNRPEVLDPALLRPGRFDRQILVDRPDLHGRQQILELHSGGLPLAEEVDLHEIAAQTPGFAGAELANLCNEAALLASRRGSQLIAPEDFQNAIERITAGLEKKNKVINTHEREIVAYHESGHAIVAHFTSGADPVQKVSIVPRGIGALGYTMQTPLEDRYLMTRGELIDKVTGLLGGRAAEEVIFNEVSTGASDDLERASKIVRDMVVVYGMSDQAPNLSLVDRRDGFLPGMGPSRAEHSEELERTIDHEVLSIISDCYDAAKRLLISKRNLLETMARALLEKEKLTSEEILMILGPRPTDGSAPGLGRKSKRATGAAGRGEKTAGPPQA